MNNASSARISSKEVGVKSLAFRCIVEMWFVPTDFLSKYHWLCPQPTQPDLKCLMSVFLHTFVH